MEPLVAGRLQFGQQVGAVWPGRTQAAINNSDWPSDNNNNNNNATTKELSAARQSPGEARLLLERERSIKLSETVFGAFKLAVIAWERHAPLFVSFPLSVALFVSLARSAEAASLAPKFGNLKERRKAERGTKWTSGSFSLCSNGSLSTEKERLSLSRSLSLSSANGNSTLQQSSSAKHCSQSTIENRSAPIDECCQMEQASRARRILLEKSCKFADDNCQQRTISWAASTFGSV